MHGRSPNCVSYDGHQQPGSETKIFLIPCITSCRRKFLRRVESVSLFVRPDYVFFLGFVMDTEGSLPA